jgi:membrane protease YdiL (CAAX protease family)
MAASFAQMRVLGLVMWRYWRRGPLPSPRVDGTARRGSGFVLRVLFLLVFVNVGYRAGVQCAQLPGDEEAVATAWLLVGLAGWSAIVGFVNGGVAVRGIQSPLYASWLDMLPLRESSRVGISLLQSPGAQILAVGAVCGAVHEQGYALPRALGFGLAWSTVSVLVGTACARVFRTFASPMVVMRAATFLVPLQLVFFVVLYSAPALATWTNAATGVSILRLRPIADEILASRSILPGAPGLAIFALVACAAIGTAERLGYDRIDVVPNRRLRSPRPETLTLRDVERLLVAREPQRTLVWFSFAYCALVSAATAYVAFAKPTRHGEGLPINGAICVATFLAYGAMAARATRLAARDLVARPMLSPLPVLPSELLRGKAQAIRRQGLFVASPLLLLLLVHGPDTSPFVIAWRVAASFAALALTAEATVSVAFLTRGLGGAQSRVATMTGFGLEGFLLLLPLMGVATAPYAWSAVVSLACVALVSLEARRAALGCIRWLDDGDGFDRDTPVWRALLVFTAFQAGQSLIGRILTVSPLRPETAEAAAYAVSAAGLVALTLQARRDLPPLRLWARGERGRAFGVAAFLALGAAAGVGSGALALGYERCLTRLGVDLGAIHPGAPTFALSFMALVAAPLAEETFFRGWLQQAVQRQDPRRRSWLAIAVTAFAFAAVHPALAFVPALLLGAVTGGLLFASGGLAAGMLAHAMHNGVVLLYGSSP